MTVMRAFSPLSHRAMRLGLLFGAEAALLVVLFQLSSDLVCRETAIETACRGLRWAGLWVICGASLLAVWLWARPGARADFMRRVAQEAGGARWAALHAAGLALLIGPVLAVPDGAMNAQFARIFPVLCAGAALAVPGGLLWLVRPASWRGWLAGRAASLVAILAFAALLPGGVVLAGPLWTVQALTDLTFIAVYLMLRLFSDAVEVYPDAYVIGADGFLVEVAETCSGIEGLVLITAFLALYAALFRDELRLRRMGLVIWPLALLASWCFNAVRITALILIGAHVSPDLAVNGFHSFAGWLMFTALAGAVLVVVGRSRWALRDCPAAAPGPAPGPLSEDDAAGRIVPFIVFALSGMIAQAFWSDPALGYPLRVALMAGALWWARRVVARHLARPSVPALLAGGAVAALWIATAPAAAPLSPGLAALSGAGLAAWVVLRVLGTAVLVPVIEEMFFRGYVQARLDRGGGASRVLAVAVSAALFAAVHGRWIEAGLAGVVFSILYLRSGRLADAIAAHASANAVIAVVALWRGDFALI
jgi:exosortase E/protease (VPEID-CTERM system)